MTGLRSFAPNDDDVAARRTVAGPDSTPPRPAGEQTVASRNAVASLTNGTPHRDFESNVDRPQFCGHLNDFEEDSKAAEMVACEPSEGRRSSVTSSGARRLKRENERLREEREILKKATAFFGESPPSAARDPSRRTSSTSRA